MTIQTDSHGCRWLAVAAWVGAIAWFLFFTFVGWGYTPGGMLFWAVPALRLEDPTRRWLARCGHAVSRQTIERLHQVWARMLGAQIALIIIAAILGDHSEAFLLPLWIPMMIAYAAFPLGVSAWAIAVSIRQGAAPHPAS